MPALTTKLTFLATGSPTGVKFVVERGGDRALFELGLEHAPGAVPFSLGLRPRPGRVLQDLLAVGMAPRGTGVLGEWDGRTHLFVSHLHLDHAGLVRWVHPSVPLYYPEAAEDLRRACQRAGHLRWREPPGTPVGDRGRVEVGSIEVEFVAVDHDLPGATGFLIRTPDLSLAFTGDHRWHGLHSELTAAFAEAARGVDVLLQEGVGLGQAGDHPMRLDEVSVARELERLLAEARGLVVVNLYPMNRERVRALGEVAAACGRRLLLEPQAAEIAAWPDRLQDLEPLLREPAGYCLQLSFESLPTLIDLAPPPGSFYVHSNGPPLVDSDPAYRVMVSWAKALGLEFVSLGSSGHSWSHDVARMVEVVRPAVVLPVHTRYPEALVVSGCSRLLPEPMRPYSAAELRALTVSQ